MPTVIAHLQNDDPVLGEIDQLPDSSTSNILIRNPRRRDGKDLPYLEANVSDVIFPLWRISFIEIVSESDEEEIITFVRGS
jgi:hypothetical protein